MPLTASVVPWLDAFAVLTAVGVLAGTARLVRHRLAARPLVATAGGPKRAPGFEPLVSVLVPARNEANSIEACVRSILAQDYRNFELIVCDDASDDATGAILDSLTSVDPRLRIVHRRGPPPRGWVGKNFALETAFAASRGDWILTVDADCRIGPRSLSAAMRRALEPEDGERRSLVSAIPRVDCVHPASRFLLPPFGVWLAVALPIHRVNSERTRAALAAGGFLLIERTALDAIGGYARLAPHIVEDVLTARLVKHSGRRIEVFLGGDDVSTEMYMGWGDAWEGLTKNAFAGVDFRLPAAVLGILAIVLFTVVPTAAILFAALPWVILGEPIFLGTPALVAFGFAAAILVALHAAVAKELRIPLPYALIAAPAHLAYAAALAVSAFRGRFGKGVAWKGRRYYGLGTPVPDDKLLT